MNKFLTLFLLIICFNVTGQSRKYVYDSISKEPLEYATVLLYKNSKVIKGSYTDSKGVFTYENLKVDSIQISNIGYQNLTVNALDLIKNNSFYLTAKKESLDEILISVKKSTDVGLINEKDNGKPLGFGYSRETGIYLENNLDGIKYITSVKFKIAKVFDPMVVRVKIYSVDTLENRLYPGKVLNNNDYLLKVDKKSKEPYEILFSEKLQFPENGMFVILEGVDFINETPKKGKKSGIRLAATRSDENIYYYKVNHSSEYWLDYNRWAIHDYRISFGKEIPRKWLSVPLIGVTIND
ncbi:hypothetical protein [Nonlabens sp.]|uniref:hypothetical protein n=3 Tax=Nonlabens sp. TaxID=1888209 RepID=UPI00326436FA